MASNRSCCIQSCKTPATVTCLGCPNLLYCRIHHQQHHEDLGKQLENLTDMRNQFQGELDSHGERITQHPLMQNIDDWELKSIETIKQVAKSTREALSVHIQGFITQLRTQLATLSTQLSAANQSQAFIDTDIQKWKEELGKLKMELNNTQDCSIRYDRTPFINKICLEVRGKFWNSI